MGPVTGPVWPGPGGPLSGGVLTWPWPNLAAEPLNLLPGAAWFGRQAFGTESRTLRLRLFLDWYMLYRARELTETEIERMDSDRPSPWPSAFTWSLTLMYLSCMYIYTNKLCKSSQCASWDAFWVGWEGVCLTITKIRPFRDSLPCPLHHRSKYLFFCFMLS